MLKDKYIILEIIPTTSRKETGFIAQIEALKVENNKIIDRLDLRVKEDLINNKDLLEMISYDKENFIYVNKDEMISRLTDFIKDDLLLIIDNDYTKDYLSDINNKKESVFKYLNMEYSDNVFEKLTYKYNLVPSNYLVDLLYEALIFENSEN